MEDDQASATPLSASLRDDDIIGEPRWPMVGAVVADRGAMARWNLFLGEDGRVRPVDPNVYWTIPEGGDHRGLLDTQGEPTQGPVWPKRA